MSIETRRNWSYQGKVWATKTLTEAIEREARARIEVLLPPGYTYSIEKTTHGFRGFFGEKGEGERGWSLQKTFQTQAGAVIGLLALLVDGCVFPKCTTSFDLLTGKHVPNQGEET